MSLHKLLLRKLILIGIGMFAFSFALVPLYSVLCKVTGINGKVPLTAAVASTSVDVQRNITVEFLAKADQSIPWAFAPQVQQVRVNPGEIKQVDFRVENLTADNMIGQAVPSISPGEAAQYFKKMECFCFTQQPLNAHESKLMRLQFYVDPALPKEFHTITLSYTLYKVPSQ